MLGKNPYLSLMLQSVCVSFASCFGRDYRNGGTASWYNDQDGEFPEAA